MPLSVFVFGLCRFPCLDVLTLIPERGREREKERRKEDIGFVEGKEEEVESTG